MHYEEIKDTKEYVDYCGEPCWDCGHSFSEKDKVYVINFSDNGLINQKSVCERCFKKNYKNLKERSEYYDSIQENIDFSDLIDGL